MSDGREFVVEKPDDLIFRNDEYLRYNIHKKSDDFKTHVVVIPKHFAYDISPEIYSKGEITDYKAINNSIMNILLTKRGEMVFEPNFGSSLMYYLFENYGDENYASNFLEKIIDEITAIETRIVMRKEMCSISISAKNHSIGLKLCYVMKNSGKVGVFEEGFVI